MHFHILIKEKAKQKGIQKTPKFDDYKKCLFNNQTTNQNNYSIQTKKHQIKVIEQNKMALNSFDDKRLYINNTQSVPWDIHTQKGDCTCILCIKYYWTLLQRINFWINR